MNWIHNLITSDAFSGLCVNWRQRAFKSHTRVFDEPIDLRDWPNTEYVLGFRQWARTLRRVNLAGTVTISKFAMPPICTQTAYGALWKMIWSKQTNFYQIMIPIHFSPNLTLPPENIDYYGCSSLMAPCKGHSFIHYQCDKVDHYWKICKLWDKISQLATKPWYSNFAHLSFTIRWITVPNFINFAKVVLWFYT